MSIQLRPGYKQSEVGVIPTEWSVHQLDSLGAGPVPPIKAGPFGSSLTKDTYVASGFKVYGQEQVIRGDYLYGDYFISLKKYRELESCAVHPGDVLLSLVGTAGKLLVVPNDAPAGVINPRLIRFSFDKTRVSPLFFKDLFEAAQVQSLLARYAQGGTMGVLNASMLRIVNIPLPPLAEQNVIADALSDTESLIESLEQLVAKKRHLKQGAMQELLTGKKRLPGFGSEWEVKRLGDVAQLKNGYAFQSSTYTGLGRYKVVTIANVQDGYMTVAECNKIAQLPPDIQSHQCLCRNDILISMTGNVGRVCRVNDDNCLLNQRVGKLLPNGIDSGFLYATLCQSKFLVAMGLKAKGGAQGNLSKPDITEYQVQLPSLPEQTAIATVLFDMDAEIAELETQLTKTRVLKQGMMHKLLTGEIRLL